MAGSRLGRAVPIYGIFYEIRPLLQYFSERCFSLLNDLKQNALSQSKKQMEQANQPIQHANATDKNNKQLISQTQ